MYREKGIKTIIFINIGTVAALKPQMLLVVKIL